MSRAYFLLFCLLFLSCRIDSNVDRYVLKNGNYQSTDSQYSATLDLDSKKVIVSVNSNPAPEHDTIIIGSKFLVKGCPTNFSYSCEMECYQLEQECLNIGDKEINNPAIGPFADEGMIICIEPIDKSSEGAAMFPETIDTTEFIEFYRE